MKKYHLLTLVFITLSVIFISPVKGQDIQLPLGTHNYLVLMNGAESGEASISLSLENDIYISKLNMSLKIVGPMGQVNIKHTSDMQETRDFAPISYNQVLEQGIEGGPSEKMVVSVNFEKGKALININQNKLSIDVSNNVRLPGAYVPYRLIQEGFKKDTVIQTLVLEPLLANEPITLTTKVEGEETVKIGDKSLKLIKVNESLGESTSYMDTKGVVYKIEMKAGGMDLVLVKKD